MKLRPALLLIMAFILISCKNQGPANVAEYYDEPYRPQYHFTPTSGWMNDPNGLVFHDGEYHLFYQYYPDSTVWGPMHWGHAVSADLIHWKHMPVALFPDSLGYIFSGSAVMDNGNTSGLGTHEDPVLAAIYTYHNPEAAAKGIKEVQYQGMAYSNNRGRSWTKYAGNPVLSNPGLPDFRDPKVTWYEKTGKWIMTLAVGDHVRFYSSADLKNWSLESEFGKNSGAHGGVWECPDLFELPVTGDSLVKKWILLVSINPGAPNGGSGTQYFIGSFDGHEFTWEEKEIKWVDQGMDNYAGVTWSNTANRRLFIGWMSNWSYAQVVPTHPWRSAMTVPRELSLLKTEGGYLIKSAPVSELNSISSLISEKKDIEISPENPFQYSTDSLVSSRIRLEATLINSNEIIVEIGNARDQQIVIGYRKETGEAYLDRTGAGVSDFEKSFAAKTHTAIMQPGDERIIMDILLDKSSIELFLNEGMFVFTDLVFPEEPYNKVTIRTDSGSPLLNKLKFFTMQSIWSQ